MARFCFLIALSSVLEFYKRILHSFAGFSDCASSLKLLLTEYTYFGCGFLAFWCFSKLCNMLVLLFVFFLVFKVSQITGHCKFGKGLSLNCFNGDQFNGVKSMSFKDGTIKMFRVSGEEGEEEIDEVVGSNGRLHGKRCDHVARDENGEEEGEGCYVEDHMFDEMSLKKMVKVQRQRANTAEFELEKERMAAASAADEAMAMILRLQNEKGSLRMQVNQLQRLAEEKDMHGEGVIQSLEWIIMNCEYERSLLVDQLRIYEEKLRPYLKDEEWNQCDRVCPSRSASPSSCDGGRFNDLLMGSLDLESFSV